MQRIKRYFPGLVFAEEFLNESSEEKFFEFVKGVCFSRYKFPSQRPFKDSSVKMGPGFIYGQLLVLVLRGILFN